MSLAKAIPYVFGIFCVMAAVQAWLSVKLHRAIRGKHANIWPELGRPGALSNTFSGSIAMSQWLRRGVYRESQDAELIRLCDAIRVSTRLYYLVFAIVIAMILFPILTAK